jgi:integrase
MNRIKFTKTWIANLQPSLEAKRITFYDADVQKLALRLTPSGAKTFYLVKRVGTRMVWVKLGSFPEMTIEQARVEAQKLLGQFAEGANPAQARRAFKAEPTLSEFFVEYGKRHGQQKRSWPADIQRFRDYLKPSLGSHKLSEIKRDRISLILSDAENAGKSPATVRQIRALSSVLFNKAIEWGYLEVNPVKGIKVNGRIISRERFLQADELPRFFQSLENEPSITMRHLILMALLTGARKENVMAMHWNEINLETATWRIPRTKNDLPQNVILSPTAIELLKLRYEDTKGGYVFPAESASGYVSDPKKAVMRVMERAGIPYGRKIENGVTLHDLRRTLGSWQANTGASLVIIGKSLNHSSLQATQVYARLSDDPVRQSVNKATEAMLEAAGLKEKAEVIPIRKEL